MKFRSVAWLLGVVWVSLAAILLIPLAFAIVAQEPWLPFAVAVAVAAGAGGGVLYQQGPSGQGQTLGHREAFLTVSCVWLSACAIGAIPFFAHPALELPLVDALFESVSGLTTTGATVLSGLDELPRSLLLWRSLSQWLGGMGMVIFGVAILPLLGVGGMGLYKAEAPGPSKDKMTPRIAETAKLLWTLYLGLTVAAAGLFWLYGMSAFDAVNHAMTTIATGGMSTHDASLGHFDSTPIHVITTAAILAGGTSFAILHRLLTGGVSWSEHPELRVYVGIFCLATAAITADLLINRSLEYASFTVALEHASFQAASILTTTGYTTRDFDAWPATSHVVLLSLFFVGGMAGSTSGGPKVIRIVLLGRVAMAQFVGLAHPRAVQVARLGQVPIDERVLSSSLGFVAMWLLLLAAGTLALAAAGSDLTTSFSAAAVSLANIGPGLGAVGPSQTFAALDTGSKCVLEALMILGRLEIYTVLIILTPGFWRA